MKFINKFTLAHVQQYKWISQLSLETLVNFMLSSKNIFFKFFY